MFDGIWANACLLHVPRAEFADVIRKAYNAMRPNGVFYASFKAGEAEGFDEPGRYYNYPSADWLRAAYAAHSWKTVDIVANKGGGYDNRPTDWLHVRSVKSG